MSNAKTSFWTMVVAKVELKLSRSKAKDLNAEIITLSVSSGREKKLVNL